jgi:recombinational DNA repair protein RecR
VKRLGIVRRLVGCFYCGQPCQGDVCRYCSDLPLRDPLVARARVPLSEAERIEAQR